MNEKFFDLKKEKQDRMINAALKVFAKNGYRHASTDDIVAEAGISKGLLFHYFINKLGLYTFIFDYSIRFMTLEISREVKKEENDFYILFMQIESAKLQVMKNYPHIQLFLDSICREEVPEALCAVEEKKNALSDMRKEIMKHADTTSFRPEVDQKKLEQILRHTVNGLHADSFIKNKFKADTLHEEIAAYLDMMKSVTNL